MIEIEIDGKKIAAKEGQMLIQAADDAGIYIPRFCYHKKLSIAANCRMCLIEVDNVKKTLPACATPVAKDMKVFTRSKMAIDAQKSVMEFLLINHPLDCPICDQGGECELQDTSMGYGSDFSNYDQGKRSVKDKDIGPLIATDMTRCIQCTRCVRFGDEVAGLRELGAVNRGEDMEITTYVERTVVSELSGNIIDLCPVGALTSKPYRFTARPWELMQHTSIAPHDCVGSNIYIHTRSKYYIAEQNVMRVVPKDNEAINEMWLSDRDRFSYQGLHSSDRVSRPLIKENNEWKEVEWHTALNFVVDHLLKIKQKHNAEQIAALASPNSTLEELYLLQKLMRGIGSQNIDHRLRQTDFRHQNYVPLHPNLGIPINEIEQCDAILLIGSNIRKEQPILGHRVRKMTLKGGQAMAINLVDHPFNFELSEKSIVNADNLPFALAGVVKALADENLTQEEQVLLANIEPTALEKKIAQQLKAGNKTAVFMGPQAINHPQASLIRHFVCLIARLSGATMGLLVEGANSVGAWLSGAVPHRTIGGVPVSTPGFDAQALFAQKLRAYFLMGVEPELDSANAGQALAALKQADLVVMLSPFKSGLMEEYAHVILPIAPFSETPGTFVNIEGRWQSFYAAAKPLGEVRPGWKVLRVLGNLLNLEGFSYNSAQEIAEEISQQITDIKKVKNDLEPFAKSASFVASKEQMNKEEVQHLVRIAEWPMYCVDNLVRRASALQEMFKIEEGAAAIRVHPDLAQRLELANDSLVTAKQGPQKITLPLIWDARIADGQVFIPAGIPETEGFGSAYAPITLERSRNP
jgi:NADH-quinone oxidoreductase subunit G